MALSSCGVPAVRDGTVSLPAERTTARRKVNGRGVAGGRFGAMGADELTDAPAGALAALVADRAASAREGGEAPLRRIGVVDGAVNAIVQVDAERALARAVEADEALAAGRSWG